MLHENLPAELYRKSGVGIAEIVDQEKIFLPFADFQPGLIQVGVCTAGGRLPHSHKDFCILVIEKITADRFSQVSTIRSPVEGEVPVLGGIKADIEAQLTGSPGPEAVPGRIGFYVAGKGSFETTRFIKPSEVIGAISLDSPAYGGIAANRDRTDTVRGNL